MIKENQSTSFALTRAHVFISGKVQGVAYRFSTLEMAANINVTGWVKNLPDGKVEAVFEGSDQAVKKMINWCYEGPKSAIVNDVTIKYEQPEGLESFEIHR